MWNLPRVANYGLKELTSLLEMNCLPKYHETRGRLGVCLQSAPTTRSDASGAFTLSDVSPGSYVLLYGMPDELVSSPEEWEGVVVGATTVVLDENGRFIQEGEGRFWEDGWESVGAQLTDAAGKTIYTDGYALSNSMGISMMVVNREREPIVVVQPRKTTEIEWQVLER